MKVCSHCQWKNGDNMTFCQNCGEPLSANTMSNTSTNVNINTSKTPVAHTIKSTGNIVFILMVLVGIIEIIAGIVMALTPYIGSPFMLFIGLILGSITMYFGYVIRCFINGYGIIVSYFERRGKE